MRKVAIALLALGLALVLVTPASATVYFSELFSYANGPLVANSGGNWFVHSGTPPTDIQVVNGVAVGDMAQGPDDSRNLGVTTGAAAKTYACFLVTIPTPGTLPVVANYFAHFKNAGSGTTFTSKTFVGPGSDNNHFRFGISTQANAGATPAPVFWPSDLNFDTQYALAIKYDAATGISYLWVNPASEASPSIQSLAADASANSGRQLVCFALRQSNTGGTTWTYKVDQVGTASTFDEACVSGPTPTSKSTWGTLKALYR
jgi:hypothetical protein